MKVAVIVSIIFGAGILLAYWWSCRAMRKRDELSAPYTGPERRSEDPQPYSGRYLGPYGDELSANDDGILHDQRKAS
jgi:hypothetical protein